MSYVQYKMIIELKKKIIILKKISAEFACSLNI